MLEHTRCLFTRSLLTRIRTGIRFQTLWRCRRLSTRIFRLVLGAMFVILLLVCFASLWTTNNAQGSISLDPVWTWKCQESRCEKVLLGEGEQPLNAEGCKMTCDEGGTLWPLPTGDVNLGKSLVALNPDSITIQLAATASAKVTELVEELGKIFNENLAKLQGGASVNTPADAKSLSVTLDLEDGDISSFVSDTDESYELHIADDGTGMVATIHAPNFFGARHGVEGLSQLITFNEYVSQFQMIELADITDAPVFPHRGVLLDTARNYISIAAIKRTIDAMSQSKLNNFHWHITDSQSFPFYSESFPKLTQYGAYSPSKIYSQDDIKGVVEYARVRGVRVIPEFDAPAHVGEGWQWSEQEGKGRMALCVKAEPWASYCVEPPCGQLNPVNDNVYDVLEGIYRDMLNVFDSDVFHMGGDEVNVNCWNTSAEVIEWLQAEGKTGTREDIIDLWDTFQQKALARLTTANGGKQLPIIIWTSDLMKQGRLTKALDNNTYTIQIWTTGNDPLIAELVNNKYKVIFSNYDALYFDCGFSAWVGEGVNWCAPYKGWQKVYENSPIDLLASQGVDEATAKQFVLGAEATLWTEQADEQSVDSRLWPRASALGERLWTNPPTDYKYGEYRIVNHRERLVKRGIEADSIQPEWCHQNEGYCYA